MVRLLCQWAENATAYMGKDRGSDACGDTTRVELERVIGLVYEGLNAKPPAKELTRAALYWARELKRSSTGLFSIEASYAIALSDALRAARKQIHRMELSHSYIKRELRETRDLYQQALAKSCPTCVPPTPLYPAGGEPCG